RAAGPAAVHLAGAAGLAVVRSVLLLQPVAQQRAAVAVLGDAVDFRHQGAVLAGDGDLQPAGAPVAGLDQPADAAGGRGQVPRLAAGAGCCYGHVAFLSSEGRPRAGVVATPPAHFMPLVLGSDPLCLCFCPFPTPRWLTGRVRLCGAAGGSGLSKSRPVQMRGSNNKYGLMP